MSDAVLSAAQEMGLELKGDYLPMGRRRNEDWAMLIGKARKLENEERRVHDRQNERFQAMAERESKLLAEIADLHVKLQEYTLKERMTKAGLDAGTQQLLLEGPQEEAAA